MVAVFREVRRVLRSDGTCWVNMGDSYATNAPGNGSFRKDRDEARYQKGQGRFHADGLKPKDLIGMPWKLAFALQADGWWLRSDIIWAKPNPMPESVTDRPTKSHEYVFMLAKSARYYWDAEAVREQALNTGGNGPWGPRGDAKRNAATRTDLPTDPWEETAGRNLRSVWTIPTQAYAGAHFATFPTKLVMPCVKAGCPPGGLVLDPFVGSGTTLVVAEALGRRGIGLDLSAEYLGLARRRLDRPHAPVPRTERHEDFPLFMKE